MRKFTVVIAALVAAIFVAYVLGVRNGSARAETIDGPAASQPAAAAAQGQPAERGAQVMQSDLFRNIAKRENPVVVSITTQSKVQTSDNGQENPFGGDDFLRRFFGVPQAGPRQQVQRALGSGFLIDKSGEILTNNHVVEGAQQIKVGLFGNDRRTYTAHVEGRDPLTDTALIKLDTSPGNLPVATLGDSASMQPGDWVMAIGNPFQLGHTVTVGVISYNGRPLTVAEGRSENVLQTDAAINPGNSGGPLINVSGQVIGINSAILAGEGTGGNIGIGFAVPINTAKRLLPELRKGKVTRGRVGLQVRTAPITDDEAKALGLPRATGALVAMVEQDSPAAKAGIRAGDVITEYNGKTVSDPDQLVQMVTSTAPGTRVPVKVYRDGKQVDTTITVEELNLEAGGERSGAKTTAEGLGLRLQDLTPDIARQLGTPATMRGAVVTDVQSGSPAFDAGMQPGDVILEVNRQRVPGAQAAVRALGAVKSGQSTFVLVWRQGNEVLVTLQR